MFKNIDELDEFLKEKKVAVIGLGVSNKPMIDYLYQLGSDVTLFDNRSEDQLDKDMINSVKEYKFKYHFGKDNLKYLHNFDIIFRSPSCLPNKKELIEEQNNGAIITTEIEQVINLAPSKVIGVTGSKGKTTTTTIIYKLLQGLGYKTYVGGNIGIPLFNKIKEMKKEDIVVLELSSFQLMNMKVSPNIALITNLSQDHLDVHGSYEEYINAKKYIYKNQSKKDILVLNYDDEYIRNLSKEANGEVRYFSKQNLKDSYILKDNYITYNDEKILDTKKLKIKGEHNYINICAAINTIKDYIDNKKIESILTEFKGVEHRLEFVKEINGVKWYNDSASTTPDKAIAGIFAFDEDVVLIAGGYDKNISYDSMAEPILNHVSKLILFGNTKDKIYEAVTNLNKKLNKNIKIYIKNNLKEVVETAHEVSVPNEVVLFSPASASFDMFKNAYDRGDQYKELVKEIKE